MNDTYMLHKRSKTSLNITPNNRKIIVMKVSTISLFVFYLFVKVSLVNKHIWRSLHNIFIIEYWAKLDNIFVKNGSVQNVYYGLSV